MLNPGPKALESNKPEPNELQRAGEWVPRQPGSARRRAGIAHAAVIFGDGGKCLAKAAYRPECGGVAHKDNTKT